MAILERLRRRTGWTIGGVLILLSAWFFIPTIGQRLAATDVTPRLVTPRGDLGVDEKSTSDHQVGDGVHLHHPARRPQG